MSGILFLAVLSVIIFIGLLIWLIIEGGDSFILFTLTAFFCAFVLIFGALSIAQPISLRREMIRANLERGQIQYQITLVEENPAIEKVKLNEWILTYNDWVNDINAEKEIYGWFAWHYNFDMSEHTYIPLV